MAEEQAIPEHTRRVAAIITAGLPRIPKVNRPFVIDVITRALHAAELRGRTEQREADAKFAGDFLMTKTSLDVQKIVDLEVAIRSQQTTT